MSLANEIDDRTVEEQLRDLGVEVIRKKSTETKIFDAMTDAEQKAWEALSGYKFWMFGYHAGRWINYNKLLDKPLANPFRDAVNLARNKIDTFEVAKHEK